MAKLGKVVECSHGLHFDKKGSALSGKVGEISDFKKAMRQCNSKQQKYLKVIVECVDKYNAVKRIFVQEIIRKQISGMGEMWMKYMKKLVPNPYMG